MSFKKTSVLFFVAMFSILIFAQVDDPNNNIQGSSSRAAGDVVTTFPTQSGGGTPVGLEHDGNGGLLLTDITDDSINTMDLTGVISSSFTGVGTPIGITTDGTNFYQTDTAGIQVLIFNSSGTQTGSFSVASETTFPEGITYNPNTGNLYVVDGTGGNIVAEYTLAGALVATFPINGSSQDGIAFAYGFYWIYDSGSDTVRQYDLTFNELSSFGGTGAAGYSNGEGLGVVGDVLYVCATGSDTVVGFDISEFANSVPTLSTYGLIGFVLLSLVAGLWIMKRNQ